MDRLFSRCQVRSRQAFVCETFYRQYATPDSSVQGRRGLITPTAADFQSIFCLGSISDFALHRPRHAERQLRCLLLTATTSDQNSVYFSKAASTVSQTCSERGLRPTTFQPHRALITASRVGLNLTHTTQSPYVSLSLHLRETGSDRP